MLGFLAKGTRVLGKGHHRHATSFLRVIVITLDCPVRVGTRSQTCPSGPCGQAAA